MIADGAGTEFLETYRDRVRQVTVEEAERAGSLLFDRQGLMLIMVGEDRVVEAARPWSSRVNVYDLDGELVRQIDGELPSTCDGTAGTEEG